MSIRAPYLHFRRVGLAPGSRSGHSVAATLFLVSFLAFGLVLCGCGGSQEPAPAEPAAEPEPPVAAEPEPEPEPKLKSIRLGLLDTVTLDPGGSTTLEVQIERNGNEGPIEVKADDPPEGISIPALEIPEGESTGQLKVSAAQKLGDKELWVTFPITASLGESSSSQPLSVTVHELHLPTFEPATGMILQPGKTATVELSILRNGFEGPIKLRVEGLPEKATAKVEDVPADASASKLTLTLASDAPDGEHNVRVVTTLFGRTIQVQVPLQVDRAPYRLQSFQFVIIEPGGTEYADVPIERRSYQGPLTLTAQALPEGVTMPDVEVGADQTTVKLRFIAAEGAKERVKSARIVSRGGRLTRSDPIVVRVERSEGRRLPPEITGDPRLASLLRRGSFGGRLTTESKNALLDLYGGTAESEAAVLRGLKWLAAHQREDGGWSLDKYPEGIEECDCQSQFELDGDIGENDSAATALALLPFLGAGVTHTRVPEEPAVLAEYQDCVEKGLQFLADTQEISKEDSKDGHLGGNTYSHALGTIVLCEAYGLSGDEDLKVPAQRAIKYLIQAQHEEGGGWRYGYRQAGDMSVMGWVVPAIRSAQLAGLVVDRSPLLRAERFIDSCAAGPEEAKLSRYSYTPGTDAKVSTSAAGLLARQYLGWRKDEPELLAGCEYLMEHLPPESGSNLGSIYYYYYGTQVLHHMEGANYDLWNYRIREHLIRTQQKTGHKAGSWNAQGADFGARGGRIYATSLALKTLEVYYRHLPMYRPVIRTGITK